MTDAMKLAERLRALVNAAPSNGTITLQWDTANRILAALSPTAEQRADTAALAANERIIESLRSLLMGTDEAADQWTYAGMEDAFFRWPVVERELRRALTALRASPDGQTAAHQGWQPIETAPRDGTHILAYEGTGDTYRAAWDQSCDCWQSFCGQYVTNTPEPELWLPWKSLPEPPARIDAHLSTGAEQ